MEQMGNWKRLLSNDHYAIVCVLGRVIALLTCCYTILLLTLNGIELVMNIPFWNVTALTALLPYAVLLGTMLVQRKAYGILLKNRRSLNAQKMADGLKYLYYAGLAKVVWTLLFLMMWVTALLTDPYFVSHFILSTGFPAQMLAGELCMLLCLTVASIPRAFALRTIRKRVVEGKVCSPGWIRIGACAELLNVGGVLFMSLVLMIADGYLGGGIVMIVLCLPLMVYYLSCAVTYEDMYKMLSSDDTGTTEPLSA